MGGRDGRDDGRPIAYEQRTMETPELYDLEGDFADATNVAKEHPEIVRELLAIAEAARSDLGDRLIDRPGGGRLLDAH